VTTAAAMRLNYSAISDVGRVRKNNQDSGYAGPWLLSVCDGVGGAARGDIASATAIQQIRRIDEDPGEEDLLALVAGALHKAHDRIGEVSDEDPSLQGTSTTAVVALFDGSRLGIGHVGDSRAYLLREGELSQLTTDHTFVQGLIDEGRIDEDEARVHPHRNLILRALDGSSDLEPDLFVVETAPGDRVLLCSDGASGALTNDRLAEVLGSGTPDFAAVELVTASLDAGSTDNVTCVVADVVDDTTALPEDLTPLLVGAAAELPRRGRGGTHGFFRRRDTGEMEPVAADIPDAAGDAIVSDPIDPEEARYAPQPRPRFLVLRRLFATLVVLGLVAGGVGAAWWWSQQQYYVSEHEDAVTIYRGIQGSVLGWELSEPYLGTNLRLEQLPSVDAATIRDGVDAGSLEDARRIVDNFFRRAEPLPADPGSSEDAESS
jgi:serine/threonine protein phosphatase PrpC